MSSVRGETRLVLAVAMAGVVAFGAGRLTAAQSSEWVEQVAAQLEAVRADIAEDFEASSDVLVGELEASSEKDLTISVRSDVEYVVIGMCDADCADLDLTIYDGEDEEVAADIEVDDYPVLRFTPTDDGVWTIQVSMVDCDADTCVFGVQGYAR